MTKAYNCTTATPVLFPLVSARVVRIIDRNLMTGSSGRDRRRNGFLDVFPHTPSVGDVRISRIRELDNRRGKARRHSSRRFSRFHACRSANRRRGDTRRCVHRFSGEERSIEPRRFDRFSIPGSTVSPARNGECVGKVVLCCRRRRGEALARARAFPRGRSLLFLLILGTGEFERGCENGGSAMRLEMREACSSC